MAAAAEIGHNSQPLTDSQQAALFHHHRRMVVDAKAKLNEANANYRNARKRAKSENVDPKMIDFAIALEKDTDGEMEKQRIEQERVAAWMGVPFGAQSELLLREPADDKAFRLGQVAGAAGETCSAPAGLPMGPWVAGWHKGQADLASTLELFKARDPAPADAEEAEVASEAVGPDDEFDSALD